MKSSTNFIESDFLNVYQDNYSLLYIHALKMLGDREEAKDVVQEVFVKLWAKREHLPGSPKIKSYLLVAVRNSILDRFAHEKVRRKFLAQVDPDAFFYIKDEAHEERALMELVQAEIEQLPDQMRLVFELSRFEEKSNAEIASQLNISINTVKTHIGRALKKLKVRVSHFLF